MILQSSLSSWLTKIRPGNVRPEANDALIRLRPEFQSTGSLPFPFTKTLSSAQTTTLEDIQGSFTATRLDPQGTALGLAPWVDLPPGVWDIDIEYSQFLQGAVSDLTAISSLSLNIVDNAVTRNHLIAQLHGGQQQFQLYRRQFRITVSKDIRTFFSLQHTIGLGTAVNIARASLIANRIL
jgi:hypothetical protein